MGRMCVHEITEADILEISFVNNPVQKASVVFLGGTKGKHKDQYDYSALEDTVKGLNNPLDGWDTLKTFSLHPHSEFDALKQGDRCPCKSGKTYAECCQLEPWVKKPHIHVTYSVTPILMPGNFQNTDYET